MPISKIAFQGTDCGNFFTSICQNRGKFRGLQVFVIIPWNNGSQGGANACAPIWGYSGGHLTTSAGSGYSYVDFRPIWTAAYKVFNSLNSIYLFDEGITVSKSDTVAYYIYPTANPPASSSDLLISRNKYIVDPAGSLPSTVIYADIEQNCFDTALGAGYSYWPTSEKVCYVYCQSVLNRTSHPNLVYGGQLTGASNITSGSCTSMYPAKKSVWIVDDAYRIMQITTLWGGSSNPQGGNIEYT